MNTDTKKKNKIKKVIAKIVDVTEPTYDARYSCPYCKAKDSYHDLDDGDATITVKCYRCKQKYKVKIPKF